MARDASIRENAGFPGMPDFRNLGVWLRVLLAVNALALLAALLRNRDIAALPREFAELAALVEPVAIASVLLLAASQRSLLSRLAFWPSVGYVEAIVAALTTAFMILFGLVEEIGLLRALWWALLAAAAIIGWLVLRARAQSPALAEARLMALTARIRPHFLFNSLNAVLGIIRSDPRRAEVALEELSDLFRVLMRDNRDLVPLSEEIALARQYLALEHLRLGDRLAVQWEIETCPPDALVPPLLLQPLLENAVYYGIEPAENPGPIVLRLARENDRVIIELTNPYDARHVHASGNQMALENIRERLLLFFDIESSLVGRKIGAQYVVRFELPYRHKRGVSR